VSAKAIVVVDLQIAASRFAYMEGKAFRHGDIVRTSLIVIINTRLLTVLLGRCTG
jgi:hypothetical protein